MKTRRRTIKNVEVFASTIEFLDEDGAEPKIKFIAAYKFHDPPIMLAGEFLKMENGRNRVFEDENEAFATAFEVAASRF